METKAGGRLQLHGIGDGQDEWVEIYLPEIKKSASFRLGVRDLLRSFMLRGFSFVR